MQTIVILGGGYGGVTVASELLADRFHDPIRIVLVDRMPFQGLKTEYYALAAGTVSDYELRVPFPRDPRLIVRHGEVAGIDFSARRVLMQDQDPLEYDLLVIALGCVDRYHGIPGAEQYACSIQTFSSARVTYQKVNDVRPYGQVTIVGGGLSGACRQSFRLSRGRGLLLQPFFKMERHSFPRLNLARLQLMDAHLRGQKTPFRFFDFPVELLQRFGLPPALPLEPEFKRLRRMRRAFHSSLFLSILR